MGSMATRSTALNEPFVKWRREGSTGPVPHRPMGPIGFALASDM